MKIKLEDYTDIVNHAQKLERERDDLIASLNFHADLNKELIRERDEAVSSCHIWQTGHAELVAERDYLLNLLQVNQRELTTVTEQRDKLIASFTTSGHNKKEFTSPYINNSKQ